MDSMKGKVCLVTGATAGNGEVTATALAARGSQVVITARNEPKAQAVCEQIAKVTGNPQVEYLLADFADLDQVREMAAASRAKFTRLDVLVNNAGAFFNQQQSNGYGVEKTFLVNHLAPFLLTNLLLDLIQASAPARIINLSSEAHRQGDMDFDDLGFEQGYLGIKAYGRSKLANLLFTYELARRLKEDSVTVNALHPGHVATDIWKNDFGFFGPALKWVLRLFLLNSEQGADNTIYLASSPEVEGTTGRYYIKREPVTSSESSNNLAVARKLWNLSSELAGLN